MSPAQEEKLDKLYDIVMDVHGDLKVHKEKNENFQLSIKNLYRVSRDQSTIIKELVDDKNKVKGAMWLAGIFGGTGFLAGIGAFMSSLFKH